MNYRHEQWLLFQICRLNHRKSDVYIKKLRFNTFLLVKDFFDYHTFVDLEIERYYRIGKIFFGWGKDVEFATFRFGGEL